MSYEFQNEKAAIGWRPLPATPPEDGINNKNKYTHSDKNKNLINTNFKPSDAIIQKAEKLGCKHASDQGEILLFISHHVSKGTMSNDWDEAYFRWLFISGEKHVKVEADLRNQV